MIPIYNLFYSDDEDTMEVTETENPLPFPKLSAEWYRRQNKKSNKNASREQGNVILVSLVLMEKSNVNKSG